ncbi:MAG: hypothetical protein ACK58T_12820, partial [Phycisphaerae bacterium]
MVEERNQRGVFRALFDLTERVDPKALNKSTLETLIKAGVLDSLPGTRAQQFQIVERAVQSAMTKHRDKARGQKSLFGGDDDDDIEESTGKPHQISLPDVPDWNHAQNLAFEKE